MNTIKVFFDRVSTMSFKRMFMMIRQIHKEHGKNPLFVFIDMVVCALKDNIGYAKVCEVTQSEFKEQKFYKIEDALEYFSIKFKENYPSLNSFYMKISKTQIIKNATVGAKIIKNY